MHLINLIYQSGGSWLNCVGLLDFFAIFNIELLPQFLMFLYYNTRKINHFSSGKKCFVFLERVSITGELKRE
jgi:hypothetical protein